MSAWIVSKGHIDVLVNACVQYDLVPVTHPTLKRLGEMLWLANHRSVNARYNEDIQVPEYEPELIEAPLGAVHVIAAIHCYDYQSCEHDGWQESEAFRLCRLLLQAVEARHPEAVERHERGHMINRYDPTSEGDYQWGYDDVREAVA